MKKKYRTGIQKQVLHLIEYGCNIMKLPYVTMEELKNELKKQNETDEQINQRLTQAVYHLKRNRYIIDKGYGKYSFNKTKERYYKRCSHLTTKYKRHYCPLKKHYIGNPDDQCIAIDSYEGNKKVSIPKCTGYSTNKGDIEISKSRLIADKAIWIGNYRFYNGSQYDPESKYYLPNLVEHEHNIC